MMIIASSLPASIIFSSIDIGVIGTATYIILSLQIIFCAIKVFLSLKFKMLYKCAIQKFCICERLSS